MSPGQIEYGSFVRKLGLHSFELAAVWAFALSGFNYLVDGNAGIRSSIGEQVAPFDIIWSIFYVVSALAVSFGISRETQRFRVAGLSVLACGAFMQFVAAVSITPIESRDFIYLIYVLAAGCRAHKAALTVIPRGRGHDSALPSS